MKDRQPERKPLVSKELKLEPKPEKDKDQVSTDERGVPREPEDYIPEKYQRKTVIHKFFGIKSRPESKTPFNVYLNPFRYALVKHCKFVSSIGSIARSIPRLKDKGQEYLKYLESSTIATIPQEKRDHEELASKLNQLAGKVLKDSTIVPEFKMLHAEFSKNVKKLKALYEIESLRITGRNLLEKLKLEDPHLDYYDPKGIDGMVSLA